VTGRPEGAGARGQNSVQGQSSAERDSGQELIAHITAGKDCLVHGSRFSIEKARRVPSADDIGIVSFPQIHFCAYPAVSTRGKLVLSGRSSDLGSSGMHVFPDISSGLGQTHPINSVGHVAGPFPTPLPILPHADTRRPIGPTAIRPEQAYRRDQLVWSAKSFS